MATSLNSRHVYSEDDNFLIGDDFITERLRREARQLHLSKFPRVRREAHFARYRNSFLKCDLHQTFKRIEQERKMLLAEIERTEADVLKQSRKKPLRETQELFHSKKAANTLMDTGSRIGSIGSEGLEGGLRSLSSDSIAVSSMADKRVSLTSQENATASKPRILVTSSMSNNGYHITFTEREKSSQRPSESKNRYSQEGEQLDEATMTTGLWHSSEVEREHNITTSEDHERGFLVPSLRRASSVEKCRGELSVAEFGRSLTARKRDSARASVPVLSASRVPSVAGKRHSVTVSSPSRSSVITRGRNSTGKHGLLKVENLSSSRASLMVGKRHSVAVSRPSRSSSVERSRELSGRHSRLNVGSLNTPRASAIARKRLSVAVSSPLESLKMAKKRDMFRSQEKDFISPEAESVAGERCMEKMPNVRATSTKDGRKNFFANVSVTVENVETHKDENAVELNKGSPNSVENASAKDNTEALRKVKDQMVPSASSGFNAATSPTSSTRNRSRSLTAASAAKIRPDQHLGKMQTHSAHERWIWTEFDGIMRGFAKALRMEHKSIANLKNTTKSEAVAENDTAKKPALSRSSQNTMTPLYFRFGVSDRIVFRI